MESDDAKQRQWSDGDWNMLIIRPIGLLPTSREKARPLVSDVPLQTSCSSNGPRNLISRRFLREFQCDRDARLLWHLPFTRIHPDNGSPKTKASRFVAAITPFQVQLLLTLLFQLCLSNSNYRCTADVKFPANHVIRSNFEFFNYFCHFDKTFHIVVRANKWLPCATFFDSIGFSSICTESQSIWWGANSANSPSK